MRPWLEWCERPLEFYQQAVDPFWLGLPGEVERDGVLAVLRAHPQRVGRDRSDLAYLDKRPDRQADLQDGPDRGHRMRSGNNVLRLNLGAAAGRKAHPEMRQALGPRTRLPKLRRAIDRVEPHYRVHLLRCGRGSDELVSGLL